MHTNGRGNDGLIEMKWLAEYLDKFRANRTFLVLRRRERDSSNHRMTSSIHLLPPFIQS